MASSKELFCGICEGRNVYSKAVQYCPECEDAFCNTCLEHHSISKATKSHKLILADNYKNLPSFILDLKTFCDEHNEKYQNYCSHHQEPLCKKCIATTHKDCKEITILEDVLRNAKSSTGLEKVEISLEDATQNIQNITADRGKNLKELIQQRKDISEEVTQIFDSLNRHLIGLKKDVLSCLNDEADKKEKRLESLLLDLKAREIKIDNLRDDIGKMKLFASDLQTFLGRRKIEELVEKEEKYIDELSVKDCVKRITLKYIPEEKVKNISRISTFGRVCTEEKPSAVTIVKRSDQQAQIATPRNNLDVNGKRSEWHKEGETYRALYSYQASDEKGLTFNEGDILQITDDSRHDWWFGHKVDFKNDTDFQGWIPCNYVQKENSLYSYPWYVGKTSKEQIERLMSRKDTIIGSFLIAESSETPDTDMYDLSVLDAKGHNPVVSCYQITPAPFGFNVDQEEYTILASNAKSLPELVANLSRDASGLCKRLTEPCRQEIDDWEVPEDSLNLTEQLRDGQYNIVWKGQWNKAVPVAIAAVKLRDSFCKQIDVLKRCRHKNIVKMYGICTPSRYIITEFMGNGNLLTFLRDADQMLVKFADLVPIAAQIADGMAYLELNSILHKDLGARNILMTERQVAKISGFQLSVAMKTADVYHGKPGEKFPIKWTAPETALYGKFSTKSDVWSYGILLMEIFTYGQTPYPAFNNRDTLENVERGYRQAKPQICTDAMYHIIQQCWNKYPDSRPTFEFLFHTMDDYFVSTEPSYEEAL